MSARGCDRENMALQGVIFSSVMSAYSISPVQTLTEIRCSSLLKTDHRSCENYTKTGTVQPGLLTKLSLVLVFSER